jgi:glycosyltransferase involved in cell wall biosynthesis
MKNKLVSIVLAVYNGEKHLEECLASLLLQTYKNFELIIINDGSNDKTHNIINTYISKFPNINYINRANKGLIYSLNEGFKVASGEFIARMDADDIALPQRLENQVTYLINNSEISFIGSDVILIDGNSKECGRIKGPKSINATKIRCFFRSPIIHPTLLIRSSALVNQFPNVYSTSFENTEDYELWTRLISQGYAAVNLPSFDLKYRVHEESITKQKAHEMKTKSFHVRKNYLTNLSISHSDSELTSLSCLTTRLYPNTGDKLCKLSFINYIYKVSFQLGYRIFKKWGITAYLQYQKEFIRFFISYQFTRLKKSSRS